MARLTWIENDVDELGNQIGYIIGYLAGGQERALYLPLTETVGMTPAQIKALAQSRANADTNLAGSRRREDILANPVKQARQWFIDHPAAIAFLENTPEQIDAAIEAMNIPANVRQVLKGVTIIARTLALLEIAE